MRYGGYDVEEFKLLAEDQVAFPQVLGILVIDISPIILSWRARLVRVVGQVPHCHFGGSTSEVYVRCCGTQLESWSRKCYACFKTTNDEPERTDTQCTNIR